MGRKPGSRGLRIGQIEFSVTGGEQLLVASRTQAPQNGPTSHTAMAGHEDAIAAADQGARAHGNSTWGGFSIDPTTWKPSRRSRASLAASSLSWATISETSCSSVVVGLQPSL